MDRRQFSLLALTGLLAAGVSACGRRGPLEPPPYTAQGQEWNRRQGRNPDGTPKRAGDPQAQGSVGRAVSEEEEQRGTVDVEERVERNRTEGQPQLPSDPTTTEPGSPASPSISPTGSRRRPPGVVPPKRAFVLDPLLE